MRVLLKKICFLITLFNLFIFLKINAQNIDKTYISKIEEELFVGNTTEAITMLETAVKKLNNKDIELLKVTNLLSKANNSIAKYDEALVYAKAALNLSQRYMKKLEEAYALDNIGNVYSNTGQFNEAKTKYLEALEIRKKHFPKDQYVLALSFKRLGDISERMGDYEESLNFLKKALEYDLEDTPLKLALKADIYRFMGYNFYVKADYDTALSYFENNLKYAKMAYKNETPYFISTYNDLGLIYSMKSQYNKSLNYYKKGLGVSVNHYGLDKHPSQVRLHYNLGTAYTYQGNKVKGLYHTKKSLDMGIEFFGENHRNLYYPYSQLGEIHGDKNGIPYILKAMEIANKMEGGKDIRISYLNDYLFKIYIKIGDYKNALKSSLTSLDIRTKLFGTNNINTIKSYNYVSQSYLSLEDYSNAKLFNTEAIKANSLKTFGVGQILSDSIKPSNFRDMDLLLASIKQRADISLETYLRENDKSELIKSHKLYAKTIPIIEGLRNQKRNYQDKIEFSTITKSIYANTIKSNILLNKSEKDKTYLERAYFISEKSKANVLREISEQAENKKGLNINKEILSLEKFLNSEISKTHSKIVKEKSDKAIDSTIIYNLESELFDLTLRKDSLEKKIETDFPKYYSLKYNKTTVRVEDIQKQIDSSTTVVEFFKSEDNLHTFIITKNNFYVESLKISGLDTQIEALNKHVINGRKEYLKVSNDLYKQIITPIRKYIKGNNLIIIPDEELWHLQFDLLTTKPVENLNKKTPYLLYDYAISYANSVSTLYNHDLSVEKDLLDECLAFSYTNNLSKSNDVNQISLKRFRNSKTDLPGTRKEIKELSKLFDGEYYYGNSANETNFKEFASKYKLIHLAMHADIDSINPQNLKIIFPTNPSEKNEDNYLYGHELYSLNIPAELVVLSACNTGMGQINKGEGILSIGNAFQYAGTKSLVLSRWEISDETTPDIMKFFYSNLKNGMTKSKALQQAKISYLNTSNSVSPYYWGSFYILGDHSALSFKHKFNYNIFIYFSVALLVIFFFLAYKKFKKIG